VEKNIRDYLAKIGAKGGKKSKRKLTREQSLAMTAARERKRKGKK
jgi:hypothetical protein